MYIWYLFPIQLTYLNNLKAMSVWMSEVRHSHRLVRWLNGCMTEWRMAEWLERTPNGLSTLHRVNELFQWVDLILFINCFIIPSICRCHVCELIFACPLWLWGQGLLCYSTIIIKIMKNVKPIPIWTHLTVE